MKPTLQFETIQPRESAPAPRHPADSYDLLAISRMMELNTDNIFQAGARALAEATGVRWAFISRFIEPLEQGAGAEGPAGEAELLGAWDGGRRGDLKIYDMHRTPCEIVAESGDFRLWRDVQKRFSDDPELREMGAKVYAGQVYYGPQGEPMGHVFVLHDSDDINEDNLRRAVRTVRDFLGAELRLLDYRDRAAREHRDARTDALTGIGNRRAFQEELDLIKFEDGDNRRLHLIDLDGMKEVNDRLGHAAGDELLILFARELAEAFAGGAGVYRLGGDEFAVITDNRHEGPSPRERIRSFLPRIHGAGFPGVDAGVGSCDYVEGGGNLECWYRMADERLYAHKRERATG